MGTFCAPNGRVEAEPSRRGRFFRRSRARHDDLSAPEAGGTGLKSVSTRTRRFGKQRDPIQQLLSNLGCEGAPLAAPLEIGRIDSPLGSRSIQLLTSREVSHDRYHGPSSSRKPEDHPRCRHGSDEPKAEKNMSTGPPIVLRFVANAAGGDDSVSRWRFLVPYAVRLGGDGRPNCRSLQPSHRP